ncbi:hypothetical protein OBBRIDRAFT_885494 [Obba rivulosa]|uniref:BAG domain-containing protein n=1 Tax=Obba rivulosa TaxID=1052685 RepID=A0A8E2DPR1_9APHY|nr:hypothetical protein OBBRIDRAFT_885494 [Obba rivulosa]
MPPMQTRHTRAASDTGAGRPQGWGTSPGAGSAGAYLHPPRPAGYVPIFLPVFPQPAVPGPHPLPAGFGSSSQVPLGTWTPAAAGAQPIIVVTPYYPPTTGLWPVGGLTPSGASTRLPPDPRLPIRRSVSEPREPTFRHEDLRYYDKVGKFAEGPHYGPVLEKVYLKKLKVKPEVNPLLGPPEEGGDHLAWNMLFSVAQCQRTTEDPGLSWRAGRQAPATWPRITHLRLISRAFPWVIEVTASTASLGVTCSDVVEGIYASLQQRVTQAQLDSAPAELKGVMGEAFRYNRSPEPDVPGGQLLYTMLRCDWLGFDTMFGGIVEGEVLARERYRGFTSCTFELRCVARQPLSESDLEERETRRRRRHRAASVASTKASQDPTRVSSREPSASSRPPPSTNLSTDGEASSRSSHPRSTSRGETKGRTGAGAGTLAQIERELDVVRSTLSPDLDRFIAASISATNNPSRTQSSGATLQRSETLVREYARLSEQLLRAVIGLDAIDLAALVGQDRDEARAARKNAVREMQEMLERLDTAWGKRS